MSGKFSKIWIGLLIAGQLALGWDPVYGHDPKSSPLEQGAPRRQVRLPVRGFSLTNQEGRAFRFEKLKGKLVLASFIYTSCPDVCPLITANMKAVQEKLKSTERRSVHFISITTDPEIDSPEVLKAYAKRYGVDFSNWSFLTGTLEELKPIWKNFGVKVERRERGLINHTSLTALIDAEGVMRFAHYGSSPDPKKMLEDARSLLSQP